MKGAALEDIADFLGHKSLTIDEAVHASGDEQVERGRVFAETKWPQR